MRSQAHPGQITHGARSLLRRSRDGDLDRRLGPGRQIRETALRLARDRGATQLADLPKPQQILIERASVLDVVCRLIEAYALAGPVIQDGQLCSVLAHNYLAYVNSLRRTLEVLGLERRTKEAVTDLQTHLQQRYGKSEVGA